VAGGNDVRLRRNSHHDSHVNSSVGEGYRASPTYRRETATSGTRIHHPIGGPPKNNDKGKQTSPEKNRRMSSNRRAINEVKRGKRLGLLKKSWWEEEDHAAQEKTGGMKECRRKVRAGSCTWVHYRCLKSAENPKSHVAEKSASCWYTAKGLSSLQVNLR